MCFEKIARDYPDEVRAYTDELGMDMADCRARRLTESLRQRWTKDDEPIDFEDLESRIGGQRFMLLMGLANSELEEWERADEDKEDFIEDHHAMYHRLAPLSPVLLSDCMQLFHKKMGMDWIINDIASHLEVADFDECIWTLTVDELSEGRPATLVGVADGKAVASKDYSETGLTAEDNAGFWTKRAGKNWLLRLACEYREQKTN